MSLVDMGTASRGGVIVNMDSVHTGGRMTHSLSTPSGVDGTPATPRHRGGKKLTVRIQMLDDSITVFQVQAKALGKVLFEQVCRQLNLLEADYFGLEYQEISTHTKYWLDLEKSLNRQVGLSLIDPVLRFCIKFYTPDPSQLEEEYTRYLFCLQIKRDLATGSLQCNDNTAALMASYIVQASCGDYVPEDYPDHTYLSSYRFVPHQDATMQRKIMENHKKHVGQTPAEADLNLLETARRCELYGMKMHPAKDIEGVPLNLAVAHMGIAVFQNTTRINTFSWAKIRKISFKRKRFLVKLHPEGYGYYKDTVEFFFEGRNECKNFWKKCVENHGFFRCAAVHNQPRRKTRVLSRGSSFRYSGKTQKQIIEFVRENYVKRQNFQRSQSFRQGPLNGSSRSQSHMYVNSSISANPLLPIDTADWDSRNQCSSSKTPSLTKKAADTVDLQDNPTEHMRSQVTAAQVETYQMKNYVPESPYSVAEHQHHSTAGLARMNSNRSVSPQSPQSWTSPNPSDHQMSQPHNICGQDPVHATLDDHNIGLNHLSHIYNSITPRRVSVGSQAYVPVSQPLTPYSKVTTKTVGLSVDLCSSMESEQAADLDDLVEEEVESDLTTSTTNRETTAPIFQELYSHQQLQTQEYQSLIAHPHYSSSNCSMSKQCMLNNNNSTETETDNIIYSDINDIRHFKYAEAVSSKTENKLSNNENVNINERNDIYATVNRKTKSKTREKHFSDEFIDESILYYTRSRHKGLDESMQKEQSNIYERSHNLKMDHEYHNDLNHPSESSSSYLGTGFRDAAYTRKDFSRPSEKELISSIDTQSSITEFHKGSSQNTQSLPRNSELSGVDSIDSYDSHYITHHSFDNLKGNNNIMQKYAVYNNNKYNPYVNEQNVSLNQYDLLPEKSEFQTSTENLYTRIAYNNEPSQEENIYDQVEKESWLRSSSCRELYDTSFENDKSKPTTTFDKQFLSSNRIDSPITRYDDSRHSMYMTKNHSIDANNQFSSLSFSKVYSSSYPGSTYSSQERHRRQSIGYNMDLNGSQDDISQDSYELLEKYDINFFGNRRKSEDHMRSCSLDSGNYIPSDDESISEQHKARSAMDVKCKSAADIMNEIWDSEDPRYLPREKLCVKSDGSFYKKVRAALTRTSSQESRSEQHETKISKSSNSSKKSHDSLYYTDSKKSRDTSKSKNSSSQNSRESLIGDYMGRNYEMPATTGKKIKQIKKKDRFEILLQSSQESRNDYYDAMESIDIDGFNTRPKVKSHDCLLSDTHSSTGNSSFYDSRDTYSTFPSKKTHRTSKVHSISLQNVEIERNTKSFSSKSPDKDKQGIDSLDKKDTLQKTVVQSNKISFRRRSDSENIFSFDQDRIESIQNYTKQWDNVKSAEEKTKKSSEYPLTPELISEFEKQQTSTAVHKHTLKEELIAKTHFEEYNPVIVPLNYSHATVERTKSDPNSLAHRARLGSNSRRHVLMHQKSIDLTPADSSDEDYIYKQIPSAPPLCKSYGHFEMQNYCDSITPPSDSKKSFFELPKSFFRDYEKRFSKMAKDEEIPYVLHKRHVMNGTAPTFTEKKHTKPKSPKSPKTPKSPKVDDSKIGKKDLLPDIIDSLLAPETKEFLFTQNIDLSKVDPVTLQVDKSVPSIQLSSPKLDITKQMDSILLEKLNKKLSQIESDSATSSRTESTQQQQTKLEQKQIELIQNIRKELQANTRKVLKPRIIPKTKISTKSKKNKTRITSFSSDDESLDSDDVFGSAEAIPARLEFSPPQSRKEIEPILRIEQSRLISAVWGRGQTMSSTEIEGSPPQCRRLADLESRYQSQKLDPLYTNATELRRISERSISIPSSEDEPITPVRRMDECTNDYQRNENIPSPILEQSEFGRSTEDIIESCMNEVGNTSDIDYTLTKNTLTKADVPKSKTKLIEDIIDSSMVMRAKGHAPILFAHARLNLSEGSVSLQRQKTAHESPTAERRAKSLDTPVISLHKLPPMNSFSSKDDTVGFDEECEILEEKSLERINAMQGDDDNVDSVHSCCGSIPTQSCYVTAEKDSILNSVAIDEEEAELLNQLKFIEKIALQGVKIKDTKKSKMKLKSGVHLILHIPKYRFTDWSPYSSANSSRKTSPGVSRASSIDSTGKGKLKANVRPFDNLRQKLDESKSKDAKIKKGQKERPRSIESRRPSRDRSKSHEETEADIAKRKERQQKLYESAMKQTITMLSPVKDTIPMFPAPEDKISVKTDGDKIIIDTEFTCKPEDHVLIAKSPRKLDTSLVKFSYSFDDGRAPEKLDKANRSFEDRNKSFEESEKSDLPEDLLLKSPNKIAQSHEIKQKIEGSVVSKKIDAKSCSLEKPVVHHYLDTEIKARSLDDKKNLSVEVKKNEEKILRSAIGDRRMFAHQYNVNEDIDMQAVISERRSLEILKRSLPSEDTKDSECGYVPSTTDSIDSFVSIDENQSTASKSLAPNESFPHRVPTIECEEPSIEDDNDIDVRRLKVSHLDANCLSLDRSKSDETGSWMTVECDEFVGSDTSENEPKTLEPDRNVLETQATLEDAVPLEYSNCATPTSELNILVTPPDVSPIIDINVLDTFENVPDKATTKRKYTLEKQSDKSKSSDSCTSCEKEVSTVRGERQDWSFSVSGGKEKSSIEDESSVSCSIARPLGISQEFGDVEHKKCLELKQKMLGSDSTQTSKPGVLDLKLNTGYDHENKEGEVRGSDTGSKFIKKPSTPTLEKQNQIDLGNSTDLDQMDDKVLKVLQKSEDSESSSGGSKKPPRIEKPARAHIGKNKIIAKSNLVEKSGKSGSDRSSQESKSSFDSKGSLSVDSKGSFETESSSGSLGAAQRKGELHLKEQQLTWKPFPTESSGSSSAEDHWHTIDAQACDLYDTSNAVRDGNESELKEPSPDEQKESDTSFQEDLNDFPANFGYPSMTTSLSCISGGSTDIGGYNPAFTLGRTLSRISERSTASEKSSIEDDISKASTHSVSMRDESIASTDHQQSLSSDSRSNTNLAYISDADRRTSAEMPDIPCDSATGDRLSSIGSINELKSPTLVTGRFSVTQVEEEHGEDIDKHTLMCLSNAGSQDSEDWPLPEIPFDHVPIKPVDSMSNLSDVAEKQYSKQNSNKIVVTVSHRESHEAATTPSGSTDLPIVIENFETFYMTAPQKARPVVIDNSADALEPEEIKSQNSSNILPYEATSYLMTESFEDSFDDKESINELTCLRSTLNAATCLSTSFNPCSSHIKKDTHLHSGSVASSSKSVILSQPTRSPAPRSPISEDDPFSNDDVFFSETIKTPFSSDDSHTTEYLRKLSRGSNNSDTSIDDILSASGGTYMDDQTTVLRNYEAHHSGGSFKKCSHSSHSEEETSSVGTDLDGTVRMGLQQKKCTHSSHSEDTSIGLSISEWSTGTNTVRQYANLSGSDSLSAVSTQSGIKSEKSNYTKSSVSSINKSMESLNEQSGSFSKMSGNNESSDGPRYDILSNSDTDRISDTTATKSDDTTLTLTEMAHTITEWSTSSSRTLKGAATGQTDNQNTGGIDTRGLRRTSHVEYVPLKQPRIGGKMMLNDEKRGSLPQVHRRSGSNGNNQNKSLEMEQNVMGKSSDVYGQNSQIKNTDNSPGDCHAAGSDKYRKRRSLEMMSKLYQSQDIASENEMNFVERLYEPKEKLTERYQSQEFVPLHTQTKTSTVLTKAREQEPIKPVRNMAKSLITRPIMQALLEHTQKMANVTESAIETKVAPKSSDEDQFPGSDNNFSDRLLAKHHSYDDKTLSKSQIREYQTSKLRQSNSFHEHMLSKYEQEKLVQQSKGESAFAGRDNGNSSATTTPSYSVTTSTENSSPLPQRAEKLIKCSPYYSSSLSSESPPNQNIQVSLHEHFAARYGSIKSPPSGNDTDSSIDVRIQDPKLPRRGYRKKRQIATKRIRSSERIFEQESSECSEGYLPEIDSGSSDPSFSHPDVISELKRSIPYEESLNEYESINIARRVNVSKYDNLIQEPDPLYQMHLEEKPSTSSKSKPAPENHPLPPSDGKPIKPIRTRKKQIQISNDPINIKEPNIVENKNQNVDYSDESETTVSIPLDLPFPDFLSDFENESIEIQHFECGLDIRVDPPPKFDDYNDTD